MTVLRERTPPPDMAAEWRRLRRALLFFCACVAIVGTMALVGTYH